MFSEKEDFFFNWKNVKWWGEYKGEEEEKAQVHIGYILNI